MNSTTTINTTFHHPNWIGLPTNGVGYTPSHPAYQPPIAVQPFSLALPAGRSPETVQTHAEKNAKRAKSFALAGGLFLTAILLRKIPAQKTAYNLIPTDWKQWAKIGLGIAGINQLNQGLQWKPPLWLGAFQTVLILNPLLLPKFTKNWWHQLAILAPSIATLTQASHWASDKAAPYLDSNYNIPPKVTQIAFSIASTLLGMKSIPFLTEKTTAAFSKASRVNTPPDSNAQTTSLTTLGGCACCSSVICLNELGGYAGGFIHSLKHKKQAEAKT